MISRRFSENVEYDFKVSIEAWNGDRWTKTLAEAVGKTAKVVLSSV